MADLDLCRVCRFHERGEGDECKRPNCPEHEQPASEDARRLQQLEDAAEEIRQWCRAYPLEVFPEPNFAEAHRVLREHGMTLDAISASNMRHVITRVGAILESRAPSARTASGDGKPASAAPPVSEDAAQLLQEACDMIESAQRELSMIRDALGVEYEPHQSLRERTLDAARAARAPSGEGSFVAFDESDPNARKKHDRIMKAMDARASSGGQPASGDVQPCDADEVERSRP